MAPTLRPFATRLRCYPMSKLPDGRRELDFGGKVILPPSVLDKLTRFEHVLDSPLLFKLINQKEQMFTNTGVLEFIAGEGQVFLPRWMMENLLIEENDFLRIERTSLPVASYCKFQPLSVDFLEITNPKAVLEHALRNFSCLTSGDLIAIRYNDRRYELSVIETLPANAVSIVECDMRVEFAAPVGYKEPTYSRGDDEEDEAMDVSDTPDPEVGGETRFPAGTGVRIDGKGVQVTHTRQRTRREEPDFSYQVSSLRFSRTCGRRTVGQKRRM